MMSMPPIEASEICRAPVALLAGGLATRLGDLTRERPKALIDVAGRPFVEHQLELFRRNGIRRVVLCLGHLGEQVRAHLGTGQSLDMDLHYAFDGPRLLGTGGSLRRALPLLGDHCWVIYGDSYLEMDYRAVLAQFRGGQHPALMTVLRNQDQWDQSNLIFRDGRVTFYSKRARRPDMTYVDYGATLVCKEVIQRLPPDEPSDLADLYSDMARRGEMAGCEVKNRFYEIGSPAGLADTRRYLSSRRAS
jgi:NDP-sugar pyrophosphorylase family protein